MTTNFLNNSFISLVSYKKLNQSALRYAAVLVCLLMLGIGNAWGVSSNPEFKIEKTTDSPTGGGMVYAYRGGGDGRAPYDKIELSIPASSWKNPDTEQTLISDITVQQSDNATASSHPDGYEVMDRSSNDATNSVYRLHMYYYAKPNTGYEFVGWYSDAAGTKQIMGSDKHYPLPGVSGSSNDPNKYYYTSTVSKPSDGNSKTYSPATWNNGEKGKTPSPSGAWNDGEFYYLRDAFRISNATKDNDSKVYVKFRVKPRVFDLGGTGFEDVTYTATGYAGSIGKTSVSTSALSSNISLSLTYDTEKYTFNGWYWAEGSFSGGANFSTEASTTYTMVAARGLTDATRVHIWPDIKRKINPVAEVTYNDDTTPYETWEEAISAAKATGVSGAIITLFQDVEEITTSQEIDRDMTLDLNGHTFSGTANYLFNVTGSGTDFTIKNDNVVEGVISFSTADVQYSYAIGVQSGAKLILESGKIYSENTKSDGSARGVEIKADGTLLMAGGNVEAQSLQSAYAVINRGTSTISGGTLYAHTTTAATAVAYLNNGTTTEISGGTFRAYAKTTTAYGIQQNVNNTMTITNATVRAEAVTKTAYSLACTSTNGVIVVNGGKYNAVAPSAVAATNVANKAQITLQGGIYRTNTNLSSCCASGYGCYELNRGETWNEGYRYEVLPTSAARNFRVVADGVSSYFTNFADLNTYINESSSPVIQIFLIVPSYTIPAGNYTLPSVATLCVPYDFDCTMYGADVPQLTSARVSPSVYRTLTLASGATLNVNGSIEVGGYQNIAGQFNNPCGAFDSKYGEIVMSSGARMNINSGANVYARGVISGQGEIDVKNGANIYESFIITDFKGGSITLTMYTANIFPLSQYYIQNIQAPMNIEYGATVNTSTGLTAGGSSYSSSIKLVGTSGAMFSMTSGAIVRKEYDPSKDRQVYSINGNATLNDISLKVASYSVNSSDYVLPLTNNMTINVQSGTTTINCSSLELTADAEINILEDANLVIASGKKLAVIDYEQWDNYPGGQYIYPLGNAYAPHRTFSRTKDNMQDARIYIKGTLTVAGGLYTSSSGASIYSDNIGMSQGRIVLQSAAPGSAWTIKHKTGTSNDALKDANVSVTAAKLHNEDGTYTATAGAAANTTYVYCAGTWKKGGCDSYTIVWKSEDGSVTLETDADQAVSDATAYNGTTPTKASTAQYTYTFNGWTTAANGGGTFYANGATPAVSGNATYYAHFTQTNRSYTVTLNTNSGTINAGNITSYTYGTGATLPTDVTRDGFEFGGWFDNEELSGDAVTTISTTATGDKAYWAKWTASNVGFYVDIVDVDNSAKKLTLNVTGWANAGWPYTINDVVYQKGNREDDRTLIVPYTGNAGEELTITVKDKLSAIKSLHKYIIPTAITSNTNISAVEANNVLFVKNGATLTIDETKTMGNIYIAPDAKMVLNDGFTLKADTVFLRTTPWASAELEIKGTGELNAQVCYTRIIKSASQYYQFGLPRNCAISEVKLSDGSTPAYTTAWLLRSYNEESRAANGANGNNWTTLAAGGTIQGGVGYEMFSSSNYYREFYFPISLTPSSITTAVSYTEGAAGPTHAGWNIVVSPLTSRYTIAPEPEGWMISWLQEDGSYSQEPASIIKSAIPFSYQAKANGSLSFDSEFSIIVASAPRRRVTAAEEPTRIQWIHLDIASADGKGDQTSIYSHPTRYEQTYKTGIDVAKQSLTASRAIIYSSHAYGDMAFAGVADSLLESGVALTVYSPATQELTFSLRDNDWLNRMEYVWLIDKETGAKIDLLSSDYSYEAAEGTTRGRFFIQGQFKTPQIVTDIQNGQSGEVQPTKARKLMINQKIFIEINGRLYDATGKEVKR